MPLHDEEMKKRREKREAQRKRQQAEARRMKRMLALAAVVLLLCGVGIIRLTKNVPSQGQPEQIRQEVQETEAPEETTKATTPAQQDPITTIHIKAAGDLNVTNDVVISGMSVGGYDFGPVFKDVAAILAEADLTVMNMEGNFVGEPYGTERTSAPNRLLNDLRSCGVDLLQTANSCIINNGMIGLTSTLQAIRNSGIEPVGAYATETEFRTGKGYTIANVRGVKVAFVAFTKGLGGRGMPDGNENLVNLLYEDYATEYEKEDVDRIDSILKNVEAEKPDITIALLHWGSEYNDDISPSQEYITSLMQKGGVDVILGTHPHTLQPVVYDRLKGTLVAYSLGDFFGDAERGATNYSIILDLEITKDATTGTTKVTDYSYTPIFTVRENECPDEQRRVVRIDKAIAAYDGNFLDKVTQATYESMKYALQRIEERMAVPTEVICPSCEKEVIVSVSSKTNTLVTSTTCKCGNVLSSGSDVKDYD